MGPSEWHEYRKGEAIAWDMYFASVCSIQYHPANPPERRMSVSEAAEVADQMLEERRCRLLPQS